MLSKATGFSLSGGFPLFDLAFSGEAAIMRSNMALLCVRCVCRASQIQCTEPAGRSLPTSHTTTDSNYS